MSPTPRWRFAGRLTRSFRSRGAAPGTFLALPGSLLLTRLWLEDGIVEESLLVEKLKEIKERSPAKQLVLLADSRLEIADVKRAMRLSDKAGFHQFGCVVQKAAGHRD